MDKLEVRRLLNQLTDLYEDMKADPGAEEEYALDIVNIFLDDVIEILQEVTA